MTDQSSTSFNFTPPFNLTSQCSRDYNINSLTFLDSLSEQPMLEHRSNFQNFSLKEQTQPQPQVRQQLTPNKAEFKLEPAPVMSIQENNSNHLSISQTLEDEKDESLDFRQIFTKNSKAALTKILSKRIFNKSMTEEEITELIGGGLESEQLLDDSSCLNGNFTNDYLNEESEEDKVISSFNDIASINSKQVFSKKSQMREEEFGILGQQEVSRNPEGEKPPSIEQRHFSFADITNQQMNNLNSKSMIVKEPKESLRYAEQENKLSSIEERSSSKKMIPSGRNNSSFLKGGKNSQQCIIDKRSTSSLSPCPSQSHKESQSKFKEKATKFKDQLDMIFHNKEEGPTFLMTKSESSQFHLMPNQSSLSDLKEANKMSKLNIQSSQISISNDHLEGHTTAQDTILNHHESMSVNQVHPGKTNVQMYLELKNELETRLQDSLQLQRLNVESQYQGKLVRVVKQVQEKYERMLIKGEEEMKKLTKKHKMEMKVLAQKIKEKEQVKHKEEQKRYESLIKNKWIEKEQQLHEKEQSYYQQQLLQEKNELKKQLKELSQRFNNQLEYTKRENEEKMKLKELEWEEHKKQEVALMEEQIEELKKQRDIYLEQQNEIVLRYQKQIQDRMERVVCEEEMRKQEWQGELENLRAVNQNLIEQLKLKNDEVFQLYEINASLNQAKTYHPLSQCEQCHQLLVANEKLLGRIKKYEQMIKYRNKSIAPGRSQMSTLGGGGSLNLAPSREGRGSSLKLYR